jgi:hypothetical protein
LRRFSTAALNALRQHAWEGGYAELKAAVKSLALASLGEEIGEDETLQLLAPAGEPSLVPAGLAPEVIELPLREAREAFERMYFEYHLAKDGGNMTRLAEKTGLERTHLYRKLKDLGPGAQIMRIIILGAGQVGASVAEALASEANDITIVDQSREALGDIADRLDVRTLVGNGALPSVLKNAGMDDADMLVAVTQSDSTNLVACKIARSVFNVTTRVARLRSADYLE